MKDNKILKVYKELGEFIFEETFPHRTNSTSTGVDVSTHLVFVDQFSERTTKHIIYNT